MSVLPELLGESSAVVGIRQTVARLLQRPRANRSLPPLLLQGETGTGKGLIARAIHGASPRGTGPFIDLNCAAIPDTLLEAELFGFERGAFTDARQAKPGLFHAANGGTIFLDEIGLLREGVQAKLLKVLEDRQVRRLGSTRSEPLDVWVVAATNDDLAQAVRERRFRADLYHRLAVITITLPPLRERGQDVLLLAEHFLARACGEYQLAAKRLTADARAALAAYPWPGNVRQLANAMERAALLSDDERIGSDLLELRAAEATGSADTPPPARAGLHETIGAAERERVREALEATGWNLSRAAARLGVARNTLRYRMQRFGLSRRPAPAPRRVASPRVPETARPGRADLPLERHRRTVAALRMAAAPTASVAETSAILEDVVEQLRGFGGEVERLGLEGCLALFGLEPVEDAARRAASAAIAIRRHGERRQGADGPRVRFRIALEVRAVPLSQLGGRWEVEPLAKSSLTVRLDELMADTAPGMITVGETAVPFLDRRFAIERSTADTRRAVHRLLGTERSGYELLGRITRFVGRTVELERLRSLVSALVGGQGHVAAVVGEPGAGKSRLLFELRRTLPAADVRWMETACVPHGGAAPFLPVMAPLRECFDLSASDAPAVIAARVREKLRASGDVDDLVSPLLSLLGALPEPHPFAVLLPAQRRERMVEAVSRLLVAETRERPVVLVVEDAHWIDRESQHVIDTIVRTASQSRLVLLVTYRPEYRHAWDGVPGFAEIRLDPLPARNAGELLDDLLGDDPSLAPVKPGLIERGGGNPFFLEESVRTLVDDGALTGSAGAYRLTGSVPPFTTPPTVRAVLAARIDRLPAARRQLLQCASVIGRMVPLALLARVAELPETAVAEEVAQLRSTQFFEDTRNPARADGVFRHALTQEVAYESLHDLERVRLHARVVEALEEMDAAGSIEHAELLAEHAIRGEVWDRAVDHLRMAGAKAYDRGALDEAIGRYERALEIVSRLPASPDTARRSIDVRLDLHAPLITVGRAHQIAALYPDAERLARELNDGSRLGQVLQRMSQFAWVDARYRVGALYAQQALAVADATHDAETRMHAHYFLGLHRHALGDYAGAIPCFSYLVEGPTAHLASKIVSVTIPLDVPAWCWRAYSCCMVGDLARAHDSLQHAVELADASEFLHARVIARTVEAVVFAYAGRAAERRATLEAAVALCERIGFIGWLGSAWCILGLVLARTDAGAAALPHIERGVELVAKTGTKLFEAQRYCWWAEALLRAGRVEGARTRAESAITLGGATEERGIEAEALLVRGLVARAEGEITEARGWLQRAVASSATIGARPLEAQCRLALGGVLERLDEHGEAARLIQGAETMFRETGATAWWPESAWRG